MWDHHVIIDFEFLNHSQTLNINLYYYQLQCVHESLKYPTLINRRNIVLLNYNTRPQLVRITQEKILDFRRSVQPYSPDLAPNNFHLFHYLQNAMNDKQFFQEDQAIIFVENFLSSKPNEFYLRGINRQPDKWQKVIQNNGKYTIDLCEFIVKLFKNKLFFTNMEIISDSTQYLPNLFRLDMTQLIFK